jgi:hypothetical protein
MKALIKAVKQTLETKQAIDNRQGRFLTVYLENWSRKNGKVLKAGYFTSTVQLAHGPTIKIRNRDIILLAADHTVKALNK